jgi:type II secretory pathway pseudopilin PulG
MDAEIRLVSRNQGLVLLAVLLFVALSSVWVALAADVWATVRQREREEELLFVGEQYRRAIESYWRASPGSAKTMPPSLDVLLVDDRFPMPIHHLRRLYADPITGGELAVMRVDNSITGVYSTSTDAPRKVANFPPRYQIFGDATSYDQWRFVFLPPRRPQRTTPPRSAALGSGSSPTQHLERTTP